MFIQTRFARLFTIALLALVVAGGARTDASAANGKISVTVGQSVTHQLDQPVSTVSVADSKIADVVVAGPREVLINGKAIGLTTLVVWDENQKSRLFDVIVRGPFSDQQIELRVRLAEVNRTRAKELGFDMLFQDEGGPSWTAGTFSGNVSTPSIPLSIFGGQNTEGLSGAIRYWSGSVEVQTMINALESNGIIKLLAEPNVVAASGGEANFLSGGEIPVPIASAGTQGGSTVTIEWKEFGVKVGFVPTIVDEGVINLDLTTEVSSLDFGNGIELGGFRIPALRTRRADTDVELKDGEILVVGGLIMEEEVHIEDKIPLLGSIPLLGRLFSNTSTAVSTTELMLVVSPNITRAMPQGAKYSMPGVDDSSGAGKGGGDE